MRQLGAFEVYQSVVLGVMIANPPWSAKVLGALPESLTLDG